MERQKVYEAIGTERDHRLHEVEARLTDEQWLAYVDALIAAMPQKFPRKGEVIHATAEQKLRALAEVLR